jgi:GNAT superfamily N-acetyltransferase
MTRRPSALPAGVSVRPEAFCGDGPSWVVARAEAELVQRYGHLDETEQGLTAATFEPPLGVFLVARSEDGPHPVGGVGLRRIGPPGIGEVKRLWVDPAWRGHCLGRRLMEGLEDAARELGLTALQLDTGDRQPEAVALYDSAGWERLDTDVDGRPLSVCHIRFAKRLD